MEEAHWIFFVSWFSKSFLFLIVFLLLPKIFLEHVTLKSSHYWAFTKRYLFNLFLPSALFLINLTKISFGLRSSPIIIVAFTITFDHHRLHRCPLFFSIIEPPPFSLPLLFVYHHLLLYLPFILFFLSPPFLFPPIHLKFSWSIGDSIGDVICDRSKR